ncbi:hypothetical protein [Devosia sp.]|uniref:hypothetical protein n=1 Tax=Devosia sp. TaxID=1871048 RepID=UPI00345C5CA9
MAGREKDETERGHKGAGGEQGAGAKTDEGRAEERGAEAHGDVEDRRAGEDDRLRHVEIGGHGAAEYGEEADGAPADILADGEDDEVAEDDGHG